MKPIARRVDSTWGWVVTAATFVLLFLAYGNAYSFGVYFQSLADTFGADRAETSLVFSIVGGLYSSLGIISGPAADRFGTRPVCLFGMVALGVGLIYASTAVNLGQVYLGFGLGVALGMGCNFAPANAGLQRWFTQRRGLASGIASTGVGLSILLMPYVIASLIDWRDWRGAMLSIGIVTLVVGSVAALLMGDPRYSARADGNISSALARFDLKRALTSRAFVMLYISSVFCCIGIFIPFVHLVAYSTDRGLPESTGIFLVATIGASSLIGRVFLAAASDRMGRRNSLATMYVGMGLGLLLWYLCAIGSGPNLVVLTLFAILFGLGYGGYVAMVAPIAAEYFGTEKIGSVLGCFMSSIAIGGFFGPWLAGHAYDLWGSYDVPILGAGAFGLCASIIVLKMPRRPYPPGQFLERASN